MDCSVYGAGLPLDGVSQLEMLTTRNSSARTEIYYGVTDNSPCATSARDHSGVADTYKPCVYGPALRTADYKIIAGGSGGMPDTWKPLPELAESEIPVLPACLAVGPNFNHTGCTLSAFLETNCSNATECCDLCANTSNCLAWTFHYNLPFASPSDGRGSEILSNKCYLTDAPDCRHNVPGATGGCKLPACAGGHKPTPPPPPPPHNRSALFRIAEDPEERNDISTSVQAQPILATLTAKLRDYQSTQEPQRKDDPKCGKAVLGHDPHVGAVWQPWCSALE